MGKDLRLDEHFPVHDIGARLKIEMDGECKTLPLLKFAPVFAFLPCFLLPGFSQWSQHDLLSASVAIT